MNHKKSVLSRLVAAPYYLWAILFIIAPLVFVIIYAFTDSNNDFTTENFTKLFGDGSMKVFFLSLAFAFIATLVCLVIAYPLAYIITKAPKKRQNSLLMLFMLPMWMNFLLRTLAWQTLLEKNGVINSILAFFHLPGISIINTPGAIILGMVYNFLPFMVLPIYNVLIKIDRDVINAARDLGANSVQTFLKVTLPLTTPGIVSGITMVFIPALTTFVISDLLGGSKILLIGNVIEQEFKQGSNWHSGSGMSLVLMVFILISMALIAKYDKDGEGTAF